MVKCSVLSKNLLFDMLWGMTPESARCYGNKKSRQLPSQGGNGEKAHRWWKVASGQGNLSSRGGL